MVSYIHLPGLREFVFVGSGNGYQITSSYRCGLRSGFVWPIGKRGDNGLFLPEVLCHFSLQRQEGFLPWHPKDCIWSPEYFYLSYMCEFPVKCRPLDPHQQCPLGDCIRGIQRGSCSLLLIHKPFLEVYLFISYAISGGLLDAKVNHAMPCFNIIWKSKGSLLTMHLILYICLNLIVTDVGKFILFPFKVMLTSFQSNPIMSQSIFLFNFTFSGASIPVILNRCMLPSILYNFTGT